MTPTEIELIAKAACDIATGNHLLYPRSDEEMAMLREVCEALNTPEENQTARQKDICEEYRLCTDYSYWKSKRRNILILLVMKAKIISKNPYAPQLGEGEIVTIVPGMETDAEGIWNVPAGKLFLCRKEDGTFAYTTPRDLQILPDTEDDALWKTFRMEAAKEAMASLMGLRGFNYSCEEVANRAIAYTDELIKHLKNIEA